MNIQLGTISAATVGSTPARAAPLPGSGGTREVEPQKLPQAKAQAAAPPPPQPSDEVATQAARELNNYLKSSNSNLQFEVDDEANKVVVRLVDSETKEVIRQIPSEEMLAISKSLDKMTGLLIKHEV